MRLAPGRGLLVDLELRAAAPPAPDQLVGGEQHGLDGLDRGGVPEHGVVAAVAQPVAARVLLVTDAPRQLVGAVHLVEHHRPPAHRGCHNGVAASLQDIDELAEPALGPRCVCRPPSDALLAGDAPTLSRTFATVPGTFVTERPVAGPVKARLVP